MPSSVTVWAIINMSGFHHWPNAPEHRAYLRNDHRHLFRLRAEVHVHHDDRVLEFHDLQDIMTSWWNTTYPSARYGTADSPARQCGPSSCERIARDLAAALTADGHRVASVEVSEDGECGATFTPYQP